MSARSISACWLALAVAGAPITRAARGSNEVAATREQDEVRVAGQVSSVSGVSVYIDLGRDDKVEVGDRVLLHPPGVATVEGIIRSVARQSARLELLPASPPVAVGVRVEVLVPRQRLEAARPPVVVPPTQVDTAKPAPPALPVAADDPALQRPPPVHPPWSHPPEAWNQDLPLLAGGARAKAEEAPRTVHGRAWFDVRQQTTSVSGTQRFGFARLGTALSMENPFGRGGELDLDIEGLARANSFDGQPDEDEQDLVVRRLAYSVGGTETRPVRWRVGRFLSGEFPALGLVDGFEWSRRDARGGSVGFDIGGLPAAFPDEEPGRDLGLALFGRWIVDERRALSLGAALQKSWHEGKADRDLVLLESEWRPSKRFTWRTNAWIDDYGSDDTLKSPGLELTQFSTQARWRMADEWSASVHAAHRRYPELLRDDFSGLSPALIADGRLDRAGLTLSHELSPRTRVDARLDAWSDQDDSGSSAELGASWRDGWLEDGTLNAALFKVDGSFSSGLGLRAGANKSFGALFGSLSYEFANYDQKDFFGEQASLAQHALYGSLDIPIGERWSLALDAERRFGDEQDGWGVGFALRLRY